jgi:hypothetical protein
MNKTSLEIPSTLTKQGKLWGVSPDQQPEYQERSKEAETIPANRRNLVADRLQPAQQDRLSSNTLSSNQRENSPFRRNSPLDPSRPEKVLQTPALEKSSTLISSRELKLDEGEQYSRYTLDGTPTDSGQGNQAALFNSYPHHGPHLEQSEAILMDVLQHNVLRPSWDGLTQLEGDLGDGEQYSRYSLDGTSTDSGQGNQKRKPAVSNRTDARCLWDSTYMPCPTCRRRKLKCDEGQPQCKLTDTLSTGPMLYWCRTKIVLQVIIASAEAFNAKVTSRKYTVEAS